MKSHNVTQVVIYTSQKLIKPRLTPNAILVTCIQSYILTLQRLVVKTFEYFHTLPATVVFALFSRYMSSTCHIRLPHQYFILPKLSHSHAQSVYIWFLYLFILFSVFFFQNAISVFCWWCKNYVAKKKRRQTMTTEIITIKLIILSLPLH